MAKFVAKNNNSAFMKLFPFFTLRDLYPRMSFDVIDLLDIITCKEINKKKSIDICKTMQSIQKYPWKSLTKALISLLNLTNRYKKKVSYNIRDKM